MSPSLEYARLDLTWSQKSIETMRDVIELGLDRCLNDHPRLLDGKMKSRCGNGIVEVGEECDCGTQESCVRSRCCDFKTCKFVRGATCATGACCDHSTCRLKSSGFMCRPAHRSCDLPEYCDGKSEYCPANRVKNNGVACYNSGESYCFNGDCQTRQSWCQVLWGPTGRVGAHSCFEENRRGSRFANCHSEKVTRSQQRASNWGRQLPCRPENVLCGRLWCDHMNEKVMFYGIVARTSISDHAGSWCDAVVADLGPKRRDPGMVPDGASCGKGKACLNSTCVPAARLNKFKNCDCNGKGVCNDLGHCHCDMGFAPPICRKTGNGGSVDSGPPPTPMKEMLPIIIVLVCVFIFALVCTVIIAYVCIRYRQRLAGIKFQYSYPYSSAVPRKSGASDSTPAVEFKKSNGSAPSDSRIKFAKKSGRSKGTAEGEKLRGPGTAPEPPPKPVTLKLNIGASRTPESPSPLTPPLPPYPNIYADPAALENGHVAYDSRPKPTISSPIFQNSTNPALDNLPTLDRRGTDQCAPPVPPPAPKAATGPPVPPLPSVAFSKPSAASTPTPPPPLNFRNPLADAVVSQPPPPPPPSFATKNAKSTSGTTKTPSSVKGTGVSRASPASSKTPSTMSKTPSTISKTPSSVSKTPSSVSKASSSVSRSTSAITKASPTSSRAPSAMTKASPSSSRASSAITKASPSSSRASSAKTKASPSSSRASSHAAPSSVAKTPSTRAPFGAARTANPPKPPPSSAKPPPPPPSYGKAPSTAWPPSKASGTSRLPPAPNSGGAPPPPPPPSSTKPISGGKMAANGPPPPPPATAKPPLTSSYRRY